MLRFTQRVSIPILLFTLTLAACAPTPIASTPTPTSAPRFSDSDVSHVVTLDKMEGHLRVSLPLWEAGNYDLAAAHSHHPVAELFTLVEAELKAKNADAPLRTALDAYSALAGEAGDAAQVKAAHQAALGAVNTARQTLTGSLTNDLAFQAKVMHGLLEGVEEEYGEAVSEGQVAELVEYQDALGFFLTARARYDSIAAMVKAEHAHEHDEIEEYLGHLAEALPGVTPPATVASPSEVETFVKGVVAEMNEVAGLQAVVGDSPVEIIASVREKMEQALKEYEEGKTDEAYELAVSAYLEGFEHVEADMVAKGEEALMTTLELQLKDLRDGIQAGKPLAELQQLVSEINANLDLAEALFK